jgi:hypothetical protein
MSNTTGVPNGAGTDYHLGEQQLTRHETNNYANTFLHIKHLSNIFMEHKIKIM